MAKTKTKTKTKGKAKGKSKAKKNLLSLKKALRNGEVRTIALPVVMVTNEDYIIWGIEFWQDLNDDGFLEAVFDDAIDPTKDLYFFAHATPLIPAMNGGIARVRELPSGTQVNSDLPVFPWTTDPDPTWIHAILPANSLADTMDYRVTIMCHGDLAAGSSEFSTP